MELGTTRDARCLGVAVRRIEAAQGRKLRVIEAEDPILADGFHQFEAGNGFRWTDGEATVPNELLDGFVAPMELVLHVAATMQYPLSVAGSARNAA